MAKLEEAEKAKLAKLVKAEIIRLKNLGYPEKRAEQLARGRYAYRRPPVKNPEQISDSEESIKQNKVNISPQETKSRLLHPVQKSLNLKKIQKSLDESDVKFGFIESITRGFKKCFDYSGRATRAEFWWWFLIFHGGTVVLVNLTRILGTPEIIEFAILFFWFVLFVPFISLGTRRLHDIGKSGLWALSWWVGWIVISVVGQLTYNFSLRFILSVAIFAWFVFLNSKQGDQHDNKYGLNPRKIQKDKVE